MNELDLPPRRPLPDGTRDRALRAVLDGLDGLDDLDTAPPRRRTAPLVAAAVVVAVLGGIAAVALTYASGADELRPASPTTVPTAGPPLPGTGFVEPFDRCKAAVAISGHAEAYPPVELWAFAEPIYVFGGVDRLLTIGDGFLCYVSPTTVRVTAPSGTAFDDVEVVMVAPHVVGVLNPKRSSVTWSQGGASSTPSTAPVQAFQLDDGTAPQDAQLSVVGAGSPDPAYVAPLPASVPEPLVVVTDRPLAPRDSGTADGATLDDCVRPPTVDNTYPGQGGTVTGESEPRLWQPLTRFDLPDGGYAISATIGGDYAGLCVLSSANHYWWDREARNADLPPLGAIHLSTVASPDRPLGGLFGVGTEVVAAQLTKADGTQIPCEVTPGLALCVGDDASGPLTLTLWGPGFGKAQQTVSFEDS